MENLTKLQNALQNENLTEPQIKIANRFLRGFKIYCAPTSSSSEYLWVDENGTYYHAGHAYKAYWNLVHALKEYKIAWSELQFFPTEGLYDTYADVWYYKSGRKWFASKEPVVIEGTKRAGEYLDDVFYNNPEVVIATVTK